MGVDLKNGKDKRLLPEKVKRARIRDAFLYENNEEITRILKEDLAKYIDGSAIGKMRLVSLDFFVPSFISKICNVYNDRPVIKFDREGKDVDRLKTLLDEIGYFTHLEDSFAAMRFHNTVLSYVRYLDEMDKMYISTLNAGNCTVIENESYNLVEDVIIYKSGDVWFVWDRPDNLHFYTKEEPTKDNYHRIKRFSLPGNEDLSGPDYWPFVISRYKDHGSFWGNGMDSIVELVRSFNILLTVTNDDSIQETIRILILKFNPEGIIGENGQMKTGMRHPIFPEGSVINDDVSGEILSADLYVDEILRLINDLSEIVSTLHGIDSVLKSEIQSNLSGIAIRLKTEPLLRAWRKQIEIARKRDLELIRKIVDVNNYHRDSNLIDPSIVDGILIDYREPQALVDEKAEYELERMRWEDGTSSPVSWMMKKNPELSEDQAKEKIKENIRLYNELNALEPVTVSPNGDNINQ